MLTAPLKPFRRRHARVESHSAQLMLIGANFHVTAGGFVNLIFDRAVDISQINPAAIRVADGAFSQVMFQGNGATLTSSMMVKVTLANIGTVPAGSDVLTAAANSGIVAVSDGGTWAGVVNVVLPFSG